MPVLDLLSKVAPIAARHFAAYIELFIDEASELSSRAAKRMVLIAVALLSAEFAVAIGCVWILDTIWNTTWRRTGIICLFVVFAVGTIVTLTIALRRSQEEKPFHRLRSEWSQDQQLILEYMDMQKSKDSNAEKKIRERDT